MYSVPFTWRWVPGWAGDGRRDTASNAREAELGQTGRCEAMDGNARAPRLSSTCRRGPRAGARTRTRSAQVRMHMHAHARTRSARVRTHTHAHAHAPRGCAPGVDALACRRQRLPLNPNNDNQPCASCDSVLRRRKNLQESREAWAESYTQRCLPQSCRNEKARKRLSSRRGRAGVRPPATAARGSSTQPERAFKGHA